MSNQNDLKSLEKALINKNYKDSYLNFLKIFKSFESLKENLNYIHYFLNLLNREKTVLIFSEKERLLEESISEIYQEIELNSEELNQKNLGNLFFKKQINQLFERELVRLIALLPVKDLEKPLVEFLLFLFKNLKSDPNQDFQIIIKMVKSREINNKTFIALINAIFDRFPYEILDSIIKVIKSEPIKLGIIEENEVLSDLYEILNKNCRIYPELFSQYIDLFFDQTIKTIEANRNYGVVIIQILKNVIELRPDLFESRFFEILHLYYLISAHKDSKLGALIEVSIKTIYNTDSLKIFQSFLNKYNSDYNILFDLMKKEYESLNTIIFEFFLDFANYLKIYYYKGKVTKDLLETYLKILEGTLKKGVTSEYFLFSVLNQLQLKKLEKSLLLQKNKNIVEVFKYDEIEQYHQTLISELIEYIRIVFGE